MLDIFEEYDRNVVLNFSGGKGLNCHSASGA